MVVLVIAVLVGRLKTKRPDLFERLSEDYALDPAPCQGSVNLTFTSVIPHLNHLDLLDHEPKPELKHCVFLPRACRCKKQWKSFLSMQRTRHCMHYVHNMAGVPASED